MGVLQESLDDLQDLLDNNVISEEKIVEILKEGVNNYLRPEDTFVGWRVKYYTRKMYSVRFMNTKTEEGDFTLDELREIYNADNPKG